ncbi:hypothetical protein [Peterkaempfera sp. SMS 1(5)a]|uniref:hypothetical protein n=1 Tax=Peterkaempfera podocarpi TaxID=3232308 RepID=UPI00366B828E
MRPRSAPPGAAAHLPRRRPRIRDAGAVYSDSCSAAWGYVLGPNSPQWRVFVRAQRVDDNRKADSSFKGEARSNSWGDALSTTVGCVRAEAWIDSGPKAVTSCWRP